MPRHDRFFTADELANLQHFEAVSTPPATDGAELEEIDAYKGVSSKSVATSHARKPRVSTSDAKRTALPVKVKQMNDASNPIVLESSEDEGGQILTTNTKSSASSARMEQQPAKIQLKVISTGLTKEEEEQDPDLAKAIRVSKLDALRRTSASTGISKSIKTSVKVVETPIITASKTTSGKSTITTNRRPNESKAPLPVATAEDEFYHLKEGDTESITAFARKASEMTVEEMIRHLNMAELATIAKDLKCWKSRYTVSA